MAYATLQDLQDRHGEETVLLLSDRNGDGEVDENDEGLTVVDKALDDATGEIDSYLAARYDLPLVSIPDILIRLCGDIALYRLADTADALTDERRQRYEDAVAWLKLASKGQVSLGLEKEPATVAAHVAVSSETRRFTRTSMRGL